MATAKEQADMDVLRDDMARLRSDIEKLGKSLAAVGHDAGNRASQAGADAVAAVEGHIKAKPLTSVLVAVGLGLIAGRLIGR